MMESLIKKQSGEKANNDSILFWRTIRCAVLVCLVGMLYCCISFAVTTAKFSAECEKSLKQIQILATTDNSDGTASNNSSSTSLNSPSSGASTDDASNTSTDDASDTSTDTTTNSSPGTLSDTKALSDSLITHMENMIAIQRNGMSNDLMSFIYGILSTILVGLCATFVAKSRANADEAKKTADEAKKNAEDAKGQAEIAENKAIETQKAIEKSQEATRIAKELRYQVRLNIISGRIVAAKYALSECNSVLANRAITQVRDEIQSLFSDEEYKLIIKRSSYNSKEIEIVYDELLDLNQNIDHFRAACRTKYTNAVLESMESAVKNYHNWIQSALDCVDGCINTRFVKTKIAGEESANKSL